MRTRLTSFVIATVLATPLATSAQIPIPGIREVPGARERARVPYNLGLEHMKAEAWDDAAKSFSTAIDIDQTFEMAFYMLGRTRMAQKKFTDAAGAYEKCRALYLRQSGRQFANAQERLRNRDTRLREIDEVIRSYQTAPPTPQVLDAIRQLQNQRREVEEAMSRGLSNMSLSLSVPAYVSTALGSAYFRMGNLAEAEKQYKAAVEADAKAGEAHSNLAVVYMETGRLDAAERSLKAAEKVGFKVHPQLKEEIKNRKKAGTD